MASIEPVAKFDEPVAKFDEPVAKFDEPVAKFDEPIEMEPSMANPVDEPLNMSDDQLGFLPMLNKSSVDKLEDKPADKPALEPALEEPIVKKTKSRVPKPTGKMDGEPSQENLNRFYKERSNPSKFGRFRYDTQGNLVEYDVSGKLIKTITLPTYRPPTEQEIREMEQERLDNITIANRVFEDVRRRLYGAIQEKKSRPEILELNREVQLADIKLQSIRFPLRSIESADSVRICDLDFDQLQEKRKYPYKIALTRVSPFTLQQLYARVGDIPLPPMVSVAEIKQMEESKEAILLFSDQDMETNPYGFLALGWPVSISYHNKVYPSSRHAIFAELATEFGDMERAKAIETAESASDIHYSVDDVAGGKEINQLKWNTTLSRLINEITVIKFKQYPELAQRLMETPTPSVIGAYEPNDIQIGIGISVDNVKARDKLSWTGENMLGKALMKIRDILYAERAQASIQPKRSRKPKSAITVPSSAAPITVPSSAAPIMEPIMEESVPVNTAPIMEQESIRTIPISASVPAPLAPIPSVRRGPRVAPKVQPLM
jgi:ribA/ribD-fused uncharacterized protein